LRGRAPAISPGAVVFFALLAATLAVAVVIVRARTPDLVLEVESISPRELVVDGFDTDPAEVEISFFVRESDPRAEVEIVAPDGQVVRTLAAATPLEAEEVVTYRWDARSDGGSLVRPERYRLQVTLPESGREMAWPRRIVVSADGGRPGR